MKKRIRSGYGLMLFELVIAIGFFSLFAAVCTHILFSARQAANEAGTLNHAILTAQNAAERFKSDIDPVRYYTESWEETDEARAAFLLHLDVSTHGGVRSALITVSEHGGKALFSLTVKTPMEELP